MTEPSQAVFLSYASQDAQAVQRIAEALRAAGIEVWFDQSELRGGDAWDQAIRKQIKSCALFIPVISANAHARGEGYFRLEWKLAVDRSHLMASDLPFLIPVVIDDTPEADDRIPERFREIQWTRLPRGETPAAFVERVQRLLSPVPSSTVRPPANAQAGAVGMIRAPVQASWSPKRALLVAVGLVALGAVAYFAIEKLWMSKPAVSSPTVATTPASAAFSPPPHSIAVLPFANVSGDKEQEYFSEGLTEEVLNSLADINGLQVAGRTSSFYFRGKDVDLGTIARKLNVATVLEGSVQRSVSTIRVTTQLTNAVTGFQVWSKTYDRPLGDVLKLQTDIATEVANALKVTLLGDVSAKIELGGTRGPAAFDAYLRGTKAYSSYTGTKDLQTAIAAFTEAIRLDPNYALAFAGRSRAYADYAAGSASELRESLDKALADAREAIRLAPELALGHLALALSFETSLDFPRARESYERALALAPGNAEVLRQSGHFLAVVGQFDKGISASSRAVALDPLNRRTHNSLGYALQGARRYAEAIAALSDAISVDPNFGGSYAVRGLAYYALGDLNSARSSCESKPDYWAAQQCLSVVYDKLGRHAEAEAELAKMKAAFGDAAAYQYATIYAQWGNIPKALESLDTAMHLRDSGLVELKTDPLMDPLRNEPRFHAIQRALNFPN